MKALDPNCAALPLRHADGRLRAQRAPGFWHDEPVRRRVIELHRTMTLAEAVRQMIDEFGQDRAPTKSALGRAWKMLDVKRAEA